MLDTRKVFLHATIIDELRRHPPAARCAHDGCLEPYEWMLSHLKANGMSGYRRENAYCAAHVRNVATRLNVPLIDCHKMISDLCAAIAHAVEKSDQEVYDDLCAQKERILRAHGKVMLSSKGKGGLFEDAAGQLIVSFQMEGAGDFAQPVCCEPFGTEIVHAFPNTVAFDASHAVNCSHQNIELRATS